MPRNSCVLVLCPSLGGPCPKDRDRRGGPSPPAKTDNDTERQLVHTLAHAIVFIASICCLLIAGAGYIRPFLLERPGSTKLGRPKL